MLRKIKNLFHPPEPPAPPPPPPPRPVFTPSEPITLLTDPKTGEVICDWQTYPAVRELFERVAEIGAKTRQCEDELTSPSTVPSGMVDAVQAAVDGEEPDVSGAAVTHREQRNETHRKLRVYQTAREELLGQLGKLRSEVAKVVCPAVKPNVEAAIAELAEAAAPFARAVRKLNDLYRKLHDADLAFTSHFRPMSFLVAGRDPVAYLSAWLAEAAKHDLLPKNHPSISEVESVKGIE